ncbi:MAG TPA: hypothetical protein VH298_07440, partial [Jatrophihabitans sp.]|nr:hypothetical protein [Jatrophihabitans sp.]
MNVMLHRRLARAATGVITAGLLCTGLVWAANPAAAAAAPYPGLSQDLGQISASSMVLAKNKLFIATGNTILVRSLSGAAITSLSNEFG